MADSNPSTQNALSVVCALDPRDQNALATALRAADAQSNALLGSIAQLHFLSWFIVDVHDGEGANPPAATPLLVMEANFDGEAEAFIAALVATEDRQSLLDRLYRHCAGYPGRNALAGYLANHVRPPEFYYVACPGHDVGRIETESRLAGRVAQEVSASGAPRGRRLEHLRQVWCRLNAAERAEIPRIPRDPFWVRYSLREHPWKALLVFVGAPLAIVGAVALLVLLLHARGFPLWDWMLPPAAVAQTACWTAWILLAVAAGIAVLFVLLLITQAPKALTWSMRFRVYVVLPLKFVWDTIRLAGPAALLLILAITGLAWSGRFLLGVANVVGLVVLLVFAVAAITFALGAIVLRIRSRERRVALEDVISDSHGVVRDPLRALAGAILLVGAVAVLAWIAVELAGFAGLALVLLAALVAAALGFIYLRELEDPVAPMRWNAAKLVRRVGRENAGVQNHFVSVTAIKPGRLRMFALTLVLRAGNLLARALYDRRGLAGIPSIHFARWQILDEGRRLMFVTNYDGGWGGYLGEFVSQAAYGITAIWSNTGGFPRSFYLFGDGARDEQRFKCYARASQVETLFWYRRYPDLTVAAIKRNAEIRRALAEFVRSFAPAGEPVPECELDAFLRRFSTPAGGAR